MSFEISELMIQLAEAKEKPPCGVTTKEPACGVTTKEPPVCKVNTKEPPLCGVTTKAPAPGQPVKPDFICTQVSTKAQITSPVIASDDLGAVRAQLRAKLTTV
jgi:hypothetical protein